MDLTTAPQTNTEIGSESCNTNPYEGQYGNFTATYSPEDNKIRLSSVSRFDDETLERVKAAGFRWAPRQQIWVAPMWTPGREDLALELAGVIDDEDKSLAERAADRAERFGDYSSNRAQDAERARSAVSAIAGNIPFGQPILVGHHSERRARKDAEKITNGMRRAVSMWEQADYWQRRAASALAHAKYKELPAVRHRRIKGLEADQRKHERNKVEAQKWLKLWLDCESEQDAELQQAKAVQIAGICWLHLPRKEGDRPDFNQCPSAHNALTNAYPNLYAPRTVAEVIEAAKNTYPATIAHCERWVTHYANRIAYERAMLGEQGGLKAEGFDIQPGGRVLVRGEWAVVLRVNKKDGQICSVTTNARYVPVRSIEEVTEYRAPSEEDAAKVKKVSKLAPLANYPGDGFLNMTKAEWEVVHADYKGSRELGQGAQRPGGYRPDVKNAETMGANYARHRVRTVVRGGGLQVVFLTDSKRVDPPPAQGTETTEAVKFERQMAEPASLPAAAVANAGAVSSEVGAKVADMADDFMAMKAKLKTGVQVVSAPQLFPTPRSLAARMVDLANLQIGARLLEPSAGTGRILEALPGVSPFPGMRQTALDVVAVEIKQSLADNLKQSGLAGVVKCADFLTCTPEELGTFDFCLMNPPFAPAALDIEHIQHAFGMLKPGGVLVAICANGPRQNAQLRPMVEACKGTWEVLPSDTFKESGTGVSTVMLSITR